MESDGYDDGVRVELDETEPYAVGSEVELVDEAPRRLLGLLNTSLSVPRVGHHHDVAPEPRRALACEPGSGNEAV